MKYGGNSQRIRGNRGIDGILLLSWIRRTSSSTASTLSTHKGGSWWRVAAQFVLPPASCLLVPCDIQGIRVHLTVQNLQRVDRTETICLLPCWSLDHTMDIFTRNIRGVRMGWYLFVFRPKGLFLCSGGTRQRSIYTSTFLSQSLGRRMGRPWPTTS